METQASTAQVALGKGIDAARLERELNAMWSGMSAPGGDRASAGVVRACVLNLVVYIPREAALEEVNRLLSEITSAPTRISAPIAKVCFTAIGSGCGRSRSKSFDSSVLSMPTIAPHDRYREK